MVNVDLSPSSGFPIGGDLGGGLVDLYAFFKSILSNKVSVPK